jgi:hypothetical protein
MSIIDDAISKYGGADEAYKNKLKEHIRNAMGYSNYVSASQNAANKPLDLSMMKGNITPAGVRSLVGGAMDMRNQAADNAAKLAGAIDTTAGSIASSQIAAGKAAKNKEGLENGVAFRPQDPIEQKILGYMQNPKNPDGSIKSLQQFEGELNNEFGQAEGITPEEIKAKISQRVPADYIQNQDKYSLMSQGYSEKQADEYSGALRYDQMSAPEKLIFETKNPEMAKHMQALGESKGLIQDVGIETDQKTGQSYPKYTVEELTKKYPNVPEQTIIQMQKPFEQKSMQDDVNQWYSDKKEAVNTLISKDGYVAFMKDPKYDEFKTKLSMEYGKVFSDREIDQLIYNTIRSSQ